MNRLEQLEKNENIKILYAYKVDDEEDIEYVNFIYVHDIEWYLQLYKQKETIEVSFYEKYDNSKHYSMYGIDLHKALKFIYEANKKIAELLYGNNKEENVYVNIGGIKDFLIELLQSGVNLDVFSKEYYICDNSVDTYMYILRPILIKIIREKSPYLYHNLPCDFGRLLELSKHYIDYPELLENYKKPTPELKEWIDKQLYNNIDTTIVSPKVLSRYLHNVSKSYFSNINNLKNSCKYSFGDLISANYKQKDCEKISKELFNLNQQELNNRIKMLCLKANWYWYDVMISNCVYTSFSPEIH